MAKGIGMRKNRSLAIDLLLHVATVRMGDSKSPIGIAHRENPIAVDQFDRTGPAFDNRSI